LKSQTAILQTLNWGFKNRILKLHILKSLFLNHKPLLHKNRAFAGAQNALVKTKQIKHWKSLSIELIHLRRKKPRPRIPSLNESICLSPWQALA
jgi:hypothetical protein